MGALQNWKSLIDLLQTDPYARDATMLDILNEPDGRSLTWSDITPLYKEVADYAYSVNPGHLQRLETRAQVLARISHLVGSHKKSWGDESHL